MSHLPFLTRLVAIDLGTALTRVARPGEGLVAEEPTRVGSPGEGALHPVRDGVVRDVEGATRFLHGLRCRAVGRSLRPVDALAFAPSDASPQERMALVQSVRGAGFRDVAVLPEPVAAAMGGGLDIGLPWAQMIVDVGDGVTDIAVIRCGRIVSAHAVRQGCGAIAAGVQRMIARDRRVAIGAEEAWRLAIAAMREGDARLRVHPEQAAGDDVCHVAAPDVRAAMEPVLEVIASTVERALGALEPQDACEIIEDGILMTGGGAWLPGLEVRLARATKLDVHRATDPARAVIHGASRILASPRLEAVMEADLFPAPLTQ